MPQSSSSPPPNPPPPPPPFPAPLGEGSKIFASRGRSVSLYGELSAEEILRIAREEDDSSSSGTRWLYLNPGASFPAAAAKEGDGGSSKLRLSVAPCVPPLQVASMDSALSMARELLLQRPAGGEERGPPPSLVVQCSTAQRAGAVAVAALLLLGDGGDGAPPSAPAAALSLARSAPFKFASNPGVFSWLERWAAQLERQQGGGGAGEGVGEGTEDCLLLPSPLVFRQLFDAASSTFTYLLADADAKEAVLIDPVRENAERDARLVEELGLELVFAINTHVHADHVTGTGKLKEIFSEKQEDRDEDEGEGGRERSGRTAVPRSAISKTAGAAADVCFEPDRDALVFGRFALRPLATPGHTEGCCSFYLAPDEAFAAAAGEGAGEATAALRRRLRRCTPGLVFTGDALLIRGCGRTDFQGGSAERLFASVRDRLFSLPDDTLVYPAHDYRGMSSSTIGEEKLQNPRLGLGRKSAAEFAELMGSLDLPKPRMIDEAVPANLRCGV